MSQCVKCPLDASGSSQMRTVLFVLSGRSEKTKIGLIFSPSQVYFFGIAPPFSKAGLDIFIVPPIASEYVSHSVPQPIAAKHVVQKTPINTGKTNFLIM